MQTSKVWARGALCTVLLMGASVFWQAQAPPQFKADMQMSGGGSNMQGKIYFSGGKMRMEMAMGGQNQVMIVDPTKKVTYMLMPADEMYMEMNANAPGPMKPPKVEAMDPANPCSSEGVTACKKLGTETVNGYASEKWEFIQEGKKSTAWIATKLRLPIKTVAADGTSVEFRNIVEGAQPANLFVVPPGYEKMDMGGMGAMMGMGGIGGMSGMGGMAGMAGMSDSSDQDDTEVDADSDTASEPGSIWEEGKGWVMNITITAKGAKEDRNQYGVSNETITVKCKASSPLGYGAPGGPGMAGPTWTHMPAAGLGSPEASAKPITYTAEWERQGILRVNMGCQGEASGNSTTTTITKGKTESKGSMTAMPTDLSISGALIISPDLDSYKFIVMVQTNKDGIEQITEKLEDHCDAKNNTTKNSTENRTVSLKQFEIEDLPLPSSRTALTGTKTMPWPADFSPFQIDMEATVQWNIAPF